MKAKKVIALLCVAAMMSGSSVTVLAEDSQPVQADVEAAAEETTEAAPAEEAAYDSRLDAGKIILTPGENETVLNFAWYSQQAGTPAVKIGTKADLSDAKVFEGTATPISKTTDNDAGEGIDYTASNKVSTGDGFVAENTTYYYSYTWNNGQDWSDVYEYTSKDFDSFQTILVGDPQMGASGSEGQGTVDDANIASDLEGWQKTLDKASEIAPDASFILSAGDQIDYSSADKDYIRELEFAAFSTPEQLRSLPLATCIGNHESKGDDYQFHYNNPNVDPELGDTNSGADYYFSYGDALFIILNSNNRNAAEHSEVMERAIASHADAKWKVVMFHHDIYGSGAPHSDVDGANLRTIFAPLMDQYDIDICLTGHDHSYARTYQIIDGKAIDYGSENAVNPDGTLYIAAGSASGSKFYELNQVQQYFIAERNNTPTPTFSTVDFSGDTFTIKTYDNTGAKYAADFTITKTQDQASLVELINESKTVDADAYTADSYQAYADAVAEAEAYLETDKDAVPAELIDNYDEENQGDNEKDPLNYYGYAQGDYAAEDSTRLKEGYAAFLDKTMDNTQGQKAAAEYQEVYSKVANAKANLVEAEPSVETDTRLDAGKIILTPGENETVLNFAWYSELSGTPAVKIGTKADLSDAKVFEGTATPISKTTDNDAGEGIDYTASNKVSTGDGFVAENTTYYYSYTWNNGQDWSDVYEYTSKDFDSFQTILVGDPQMGASGSEGQGTVDDANIASDLEGWQKTLDKASEIAPDASFILSAGDQIDYSSADKDYIRELEFAAFSTPEQLRSLPLATCIGNHESKGDDYQFHYNNPNVDPELGDTNSGADYYFSYGDALFIILNSNNRNAAEHSEVMERAIASHADAKWKVVMFHHDIYGSGAPHSDVDGANLRTIFAPLMDQYDIDVCLTGHDHSYARTYQIIDGKAIDYGVDSATNPDGTLYIAAGSASGSKFYELNSVQQYYIAERNNNPTPTFSTIDFSGDSLTIKTYDYNGDKYARDFTINKTEDQDSLVELINESKTVDAADYTEDSYQAYAAAVKAAEEFLETEKDAVPSELIDNYDEENQGDNEKDPLNYYGYAQGDYAAEDSTRLKEGYAPFLDKTMDNSQAIIESAAYQQVYSHLAEAKADLVLAEVPYTDVAEGSYYYDAALSLYSKGIMTGMDEEHFGPSVTLSRAHFVTILYRMAGSPEVTSAADFSDVPEGQFYSDAVAWAAETGVVGGYEDGTFGPSDEITREQIATMLYRYNGSADVSAQASVLDFPDASKISPFAREAMTWAVSANIMSGREDGNLAPVDNASRADAAVMVDRYLG